MTDGSRHILPFFIPHMGCPHRCVFCDQHQVSGQSDYPKKEEIEKAIQLWQEEILPEIAFYGGSFTGLSEEWQSYFLLPAKNALLAGRARGIRVSTRPDCINDQILDHLASFGVTTVELGVQSMDDGVLALSGRGHRAEDTVQAVRLLKSRGFRVGVQLMPGLPGDTPEKSMAGVRTLVRLRPDMARIYPTLVLKNTPLHKMFINNEYQPLSLEQAVDLSRDMLAVLRADGVQVIRIGLQPTAEINTGAEVAAGPFHPAFGELAESQLMREQMVLALQILYDHPLSHRRFPPRVKFFVARQDCSLAAGHGRANIIYLQNRFPLGEIRIAGEKERRRSDLAVTSEEPGFPTIQLREADFLASYTARLKAVSDVGGENHGDDPGGSRFGCQSTGGCFGGSL